MNKFYCLKCRRKLKHKDHYSYNPNFTNYISANSWICEHCQILYVFVGTSNNQDAIIAFHRMKKEEEGSWVKKKTKKKKLEVCIKLSNVYSVENPSLLILILFLLFVENVKLKRECLSVVMNSKEMRKKNESERSW